jgi:DNA-binding LacI/PurR family transcriptional regulator
MEGRLVETGDFSEESGQRAMTALLDRAPDLDAVFAASDLMALGAMRVLKETGRKVPDQVAVVGFDDSVLARHAEPQLTTVRQPVEEMGRQMTRLLLAKLAGEAVGVSVILETELVVRASA